MAAHLKRHSGPLTLAEHITLGEKRESWCRVEMTNEQQHQRKTRKHYDHAFNSFELGESTIVDEDRLVWPDDNMNKKLERKHFPCIYISTSCAILDASDRTFPRILLLQSFEDLEGRNCQTLHRGVLWQPAINKNRLIVI